MKEKHFMTSVIKLNRYSPLEQTELVTTKAHSKNRLPSIIKKTNKRLKVIEKPKAIIKSSFLYEKIESNQKHKFEIFAYCSKNYEDAYNFVIDSWVKLDTVSKVTIYTDWDLQTNLNKVQVINMFDPSNDWLTGTGRRLDVIKHFSKTNRGQEKNILFLDIDCFMVQDVSEIFSKDFDIAITRLHSREHYSDNTATAGLWFARLTPGYYNFINDWFIRAQQLKTVGKGIRQHHISYVQYSFTDIAKKQNANYNVLPIDEKIYNSEHTELTRWYQLITQHHPKILHYKGRRFRNQKIITEVTNRTKEYSHDAI